MCPTHKKRCPHCGYLDVIKWGKRAGLHGDKDLANPKAADWNSKQNLHKKLSKES